MTEKTLDDVRCPVCGEKMLLHDYDVDEDAWLLRLELYCGNNRCQEDNIPEGERSIECVGLDVTIALGNARIIKEVRA